MTEGDLTDILTVPDGRDELLARHRRLFPNADGLTAWNRQSMFRVKYDHECGTPWHRDCPYEADTAPTTPDTQTGEAW